MTVVQGLDVCYRDVDSYGITMFSGIITHFYREEPDSLNGLVQPLEALENKLGYFLERFPEYRKTLRLAVAHEESGSKSYGYLGWRWHDVETHPTKLIRLVTEGVSKISLRTRQSTMYLLKDRDAVKRVLSRRE